MTFGLLIGFNRLATLLLFQILVSHIFLHVVTFLCHYDVILLMTSFASELGMPSVTLRTYVQTPYRKLQSVATYVLIYLLIY